LRAESGSSRTVDYFVQYVIMLFQSDRIGNDLTDLTQNTIQNTNYLNRVLSYDSSAKSSFMDFASQYPGMMSQGTVQGGGLGGSEIEQESKLLWSLQERPLEKLQLFPRPFVTVPYLGKGSCDPMIESQLFFGEMIQNKKSVSPILENDFSKMDPGKNYPIEETALNGWVRGGIASRESEEQHFSAKSRSSWKD